jgi:hypothetical protein
MLLQKIHFVSLLEQRLLTLGLISILFYTSINKFYVQGKLLI